MPTEVEKELLKTTRNKKRKHNKIVILARSKLNSIESKISEALINNEISHEDFMKIINEDKNYRELKESIRMIKSKKIDSDQVIKYKPMLFYCLKRKKKQQKNKTKQNTKSINPVVPKIRYGGTMILSKCAIYKNSYQKARSEKITK